MSHTFYFLFSAWAAGSIAYEIFGQMNPLHAEERDIPPLKYVLEFHSCLDQSNLLFSYWIMFLYQTLSNYQCSYKVRDKEIFLANILKSLNYFLLLGIWYIRSQLKYFRFHFIRSDDYIVDLVVDNMLNEEPKHRLSCSTASTILTLLLYDFQSVWFLPEYEITKEQIES